MTESSFHRAPAWPRLFGTAVASVVLASTAVLAGPPAPKSKISLEAVGTKRGIVTTQVESGFPVTLRLTSNGELGIGTSFAPPSFPTYGRTGFLVFEDPDGCHSWVPGEQCAGVDETMLEFTLDDDLPGVSDSLHGNAARLMALTDTGGGGRPKVFTYNFKTGRNDLLVEYGPDAGGPDLLAMRCVSTAPGASYPFNGCSSDADCQPSETCQTVPTSPDGYGYGADDDLPGLVVLSDTGVGIVLDENFNPTRPRKARNLAGFLNSVGYELNDATSHTSYIAHITVPEGPHSAGLFSPVVLLDNCAGPPGCTCGDHPGPGGPCPDRQVRIDGGPILTNPDLDHVLESRVITVHVFVVNGTAPSILEDLNRDGIVSAIDAKAAGYRLLSGEEIIQFKQIHEEPLFEETGFLFDFDGSGMNPFVAPVTVGTLTPIPR